MSLFHYFSSNPDKRARFIFNAIAPFYRKIDFSKSSHYLNAISHIDNEIGISHKSVLDVGTGTGDWGAMFNQFGAIKIHGVDFSEKMIQKGRNKHTGVEFSMGNAESLTNYADKSFDIVTASFVIHGVKKDRRLKILSEMSRISKSYIILHDFIGKTPAFIKILEFLEQSDYKHFKKNISNELNQYLTEISTTKIKEGTGVYIYKCK